MNYMIEEKTELELRLLQERYEDLEKRFDALQDIIDNQTDKILDYCVPKVIKSFREQSYELLKFMPDDYGELSFFEQLCFESRTGNIFNYPYVWDCVNGFCELIISKLPMEM